MLEPRPREIRTSLLSRNPCLERKRGRGAPLGLPRPWSCLPRKGRQASGLAEASTLIGAPALDAGRLTSAGTNPPGREKRGVRHQGAQLINEGGTPECVSVPGRPTPARHPAH